MRRWNESSESAVPRENAPKSDSLKSDSLSLIIHFHVTISFQIEPSCHLLVLTASSTAAAPQSSPWLCPPLPTPALTSACSSVLQFNTPYTTGTPVSSWTRINPCETDSEMYSKCCVEPLIKTPIAIAAEKGPLSGVVPVAVAVAVAVAGEVGSRREDVPMRSEAFAEAWIWDAAINLGHAQIYEQRALDRVFEAVDSPRASHGELVTTGNGLDDNVVPLDPTLDHRLDRTLDQRRDDIGVPPGNTTGSARRHSRARERER